MQMAGSAKIGNLSPCVVRCGKSTPKIHVWSCETENIQSRKAEPDAEAGRLAAISREGQS
jgi:hypothetical protein